MAKYMIMRFYEWVEVKAGVPCTGFICTLHLIHLYLVSGSVTVCILLTLRSAWFSLIGVLSPACF